MFAEHLRKNYAEKRTRINRQRWTYLYLVPFILVLAGSKADASGLNAEGLGNQQAAKTSNVAEAQRLNGGSDEKAKDSTLITKSESTKALPDNSTSISSTGVKTTAPVAKSNIAHETADAVNQIPGVKLKKEDLETPSSPPIKGFHPIKRLLRPVENLEGMSIKLEQQIMKLEGPIASLQPPMLSLQKKMTGVDEQIGKMQSRLTGVQSEVSGVRSDLSGMRKEISELKPPIISLQKPIAGVSKPLEDLDNKLTYILMAILVASIAIAIGTPMAAILVYRNRHKIFPDLKEHEMPKVIEGKEPAIR